MSTYPTQVSPSSPRQGPSEPAWLVPVLLGGIAVFLFLSPWPLGAKLQSVSIAVSVNIPSHMLAVGRMVLPMSARNTGIYLGGVLAVGLLLLTGRSRANRLPPRGPFLLLGGFIAAMIVDGFNSVLDTWHATNGTIMPWYRPSNDLRVITGIFGGFAVTLIVMSIANGLLWRREPDPVAEDMLDLGGYVIVCILLVLAVLRRPAMLYWPLALLSIAGVLLLAALANTVMIVLGLRLQRRAQTWRDALPVYLGSLTFAFCEVAVAGTIARLHG